MSRKKLHGKKGKSCGYFGDSKDHYYGGYNDYDYYYGGFTFHPKCFSISRTSNYKTYSSTYNYSLRHIYGVDHKYSSFYSRRKGWKCKLSLLRPASTSSLKNLPRAKNIKKLAKNIVLMDQALLDCYGRFIALLPHSLLKDPIHLYFQFQDTYWWYTDIWQEKYPDMLPKLSLKLFGYLICDDCDILKKYVPLEKHEKNYATWKKYCKTIPLRGAIILNHDLKKCLLVKGWSRACWSFPRGKIDEREKDARCAGREIYEELGVDISSYIDKRVYLETYVEKQSIKLYIIPGVSEDTKFEPRTRKEIGDIRWFEINKLPTPNNLTVDSSIFKSSNERINDIFVAPFIPGLKRWISLFRLIHIDQNESESDESRDPFIACRYAIAKMDKETLKKVQQINYSEEEDDALLHLCDEWDEWGEQEDVEKRELRKKERREKKKELEEERIKELIRVLKKEEEQKRRELMRLMKLEEEEEKSEKEETEEYQTETQVVQDEIEEQAKQQQHYVWKEEKQLELDLGLQREKTAQEKELMRVLKVGQISDSSISNEKKKKKKKKKEKKKEKEKMQEKEKEEEKEKEKEKGESETDEKKEKGNETEKEKQTNKEANVPELPQSQARVVTSELCNYESLSVYDKSENSFATQDIYRNIYEQLFGKKKKNLKKNKEKNSSNENSGEENIYRFSTKNMEKENNEKTVKVEEENKIVIVNEYENLMKREDEQEQKEENNVEEKEQNEKKDNEENEETDKKVKKNTIKDAVNSIDPLKKPLAKKEMKSNITKAKNIRETDYNGYARGTGKHMPTKRDLHRWSKYDDGHYAEEKGYSQVYDLKYDKLTQKPGYNSPFKKLKEIGLKSYDEYSVSRMKKKYGPKFYGSSIYMYGYYMNDYNSYKIRGRAKLNFSSVERVGNANTYKIKKQNVFTNKKAIDKVEDNGHVKKTSSGIKQDTGKIMPYEKMQNNLQNGVIPEKEKEMGQEMEKEKETETETQRKKEKDKEDENIKEKEREAEKERERERERERVRVREKEKEEWKGQEKEREKEREKKNSEKREPRKIIKKVLLRKEKKGTSGEADKGFVYEQSSKTTDVGNTFNTHTLETKTEQNIWGIKYLPKTQKEEEEPVVSEDRRSYSQKSKKNKKHNKSISNEVNTSGGEVHVNSATINGINDKKVRLNSVKKKDNVQEEKKVPKRVLIRNNKVNKEEKSQEKDNSKKPDEKNSKSNGSICLSSSSMFAGDTQMNSMLMMRDCGGEYGHKTQEKEKGNEKRRREIFIFGRDEKSKEEIKKMLINKLMERDEFIENKNSALKNDFKKDDGEIKISKEELVRKNEAMIVKDGSIKKKREKEKEKESSTYNEETETEMETETVTMVNNDTETDKGKKIGTKQYVENVRSQITNISKTAVSKGIKQSKVKTEEMQISIKDGKDERDDKCKPIKKERLSKVRYKQKHLDSDLENPFDIFDHWADEKVDKKKRKKKKDKKKEKLDGRNEEEVEEDEVEEEEVEEDDLEIYTRYERERILNAQTRKKAL